MRMLTMLILALLSRLELAAQEVKPELGNHIRPLIERFETDQAALRRRWNVPLSTRTRTRFRRFYREKLKVLETLDYTRLNIEESIDWQLLNAKLKRSLDKLDGDEKAAQENQPLLGFLAPLVDYLHMRGDMEIFSPKAAATAFATASEKLGILRKDLSKKDRPEESSIVAYRCAGEVEKLIESLKIWWQFYADYDPEFSWWLRKPFAKLEKDLQSYAAFLREGLAKTEADERDAILGDPIGAEALSMSLHSECLPYSAEELIALAETRFQLCEKRQIEAARRLGFKDDWRSAQESVKDLYLAPGKQPQLIRDLANEAIDYVENNDLVTVPDLCKEIWRMDMMSPARQKVTPYFTGGEVVTVAFPTDGMNHADKLMTLRGNNRHFSRAVVHHELIPGHHLQGFIIDRHRPWRRIFRTPFWVEGWALYWEMLLWDRGFARNAEDELGMLFWMKHRCARVIFSLSFHLKKMTAQDCVELLVNRVGHERKNAEAEVRRSVIGDYPPLYQASYLLGGLQIMALRQEMVGPDKMSNRAFHDFILQQNAIPIEFIRAAMKKKKLPKDFRTKWRFTND